MTPLSPDGHQGKCGACSGDAWNLDLDVPVDCGCPCHQDQS